MSLLNHILRTHDSGTGLPVVPLLVILDITLLGQLKVGFVWVVFVFENAPEMPRLHSPEEANLGSTSVWARIEAPIPYRRQRVAAPLRGPLEEGLRARERRGNFAQSVLS